MFELLVLGVKVRMLAKLFTPCHSVIDNYNCMVVLCIGQPLKLGWKDFLGVWCSKHLCFYNSLSIYIRVMQNYYVVN